MIQASKVRFGLLGPLLLGVCLVSGVHAQEATNAPAAGESDKLSEIIVTAQKREQNMQTVGTSITAFDANSLAQLGLHDVTDITQQVPGLQYNQFGSTVTVYNIRGVSQNDFSDHEEPPVAVYSDGAYIASTGALAGSLFDLQRVEVLRGPQGTLFGRNATGGTIQYVSNKPTDELEGYFDATVGNYDEIDTEGALSGPLAQGLDGRIAFAQDYHSGYIDNLVGHPVEDLNQLAFRAQLDYKPVSGLDFLVNLHGVNNDHETQGDYSWAASRPDATGRGVFTPGLPDFNNYIDPSTNPFDQEEGRRGIFNRTVWGITGTTTWKTDAFTLTSVTDYLQVQKRYGEDSAATPYPVFTYDVFYHYNQYSEELRLNGDLDGGALRWTGGLYYLHYLTLMDGLTDFNPNANFFCFPTVPLSGCEPGPGVAYALFTLHDSSPAVFGQLEYDLSPKWTLIGGARYTYDNKSIDYLFNSTTSPFPFLQQLLYYNPSTDPTAARDWNIVTWKGELDYKVVKDTMLYASVNRGAKGGGWSAPTAFPVDPAQLPYNEEKLTSYEAGFKSTFWDGKARLNGDVFYYTYKDYQGFFLDIATEVVENVNAREKGGELELALLPAHGLTLQLGLSHLETIVPFVPTPAGIYVPGQMPQAPHWSLNAVARYEWAVPGGQLSVEADGKYNSYQYLELLNAPVDLQPGYLVANTQLGFMSENGHWEVDAWVKNIGDKWYRMYNLDLSSVLGMNEGVYGPPRTYGLTGRYHFGR